MNAPYDRCALDENEWRIGADSFDAILNQMKDLTPLCRLLEFGSGESTRAFSVLLPEVEIVSIDQDARWMVQFSPHEGRNVELHVAPLKTQLVAGLLCRTYDFRPTGIFDAVLVDGPTGTTPNGRLGAMILGFEALRVGGLVFLDDARRAGELRAAADFIERMGARFRFLDVGHGVAVFEKTGAKLALPASLAVSSGVSFSLQQLKVGARKLRGR